MAKPMKNKSIIVGAVVLFGMVGIIAVVGFGGQDSLNLSEDYGLDKAVVYRSPNCGCCGLYPAHLKSNGLEVEVESVEDVAPVKEGNGLPHSVYSCHTTLIGDLVVEGHMPVEAIVAALEDAEVARIALPGMPAGSPGMPGAKQGAFTVYSIDDNGEVEKFMEI